ncbi:hypothetical protein [Alteribacillus bidgolensis]|uniref:Uncharacterized protein n=1 Tax=Alteribacillus bidgolensis TaxID=930129 RepID=A0A1G8MGJ2_9BACI|nr:hypothetical protein [Alteribacillus bidgolensis]SDI66992.1 hypothetical protein SAMN05216352_11032 [Alteribacillus bidgolensis]
MDEQRKNLLFYMTMGTIGLLAIALASIQNISQMNHTGHLAMFGFIFISLYIEYLEKKVGIEKRIRRLNKMAFVIVFLGISFMYIM